MQYIELKRQLADFTIFSLADIRRIDSHFYRRRLNEWQDKKYIIKLLRGFYIFSDLKLSEKVIFEIANKIYGPSYISLEAAFAYYGLIPEAVYGVTSVSTKRTYRFKTPIAKFTYRTLKPSLFFGYNLIENNGKRFKIASPEKAVLDYFYINPSIRDVEAYSSLRISKGIFFEIVDEKKIKVFLRRFGQRRLTKRVKDFLGFMKNA